MSDIFAKPDLPDPTAITCPECGKLPGTICAEAPNTWNHGTRIWLANNITALKYLKQPESEYTTQAPKDSYAEGWNDAIDAIIERLRQ